MRPGFSLPPSVIAATVVVLIAAAAAPAAAKRVDGVVNLNTAPPEVLSLLPGVGPSKATGIVSYRRRRPFRTVDELVRVKGIGRRMVRELRGHLAVSGPSTLRSAGAAIAIDEPAVGPPPGRLAAGGVTAPRPAVAAVRPVLRVAVARAPPRSRAVDRPPRSPANHCAAPP